MRIDYSKKFVKDYKRRIEYNRKLSKKFDERVQLFVINSRNPILNDHQLSGWLRDYRAFSITGNIRVLYIIDNEKIVFDDIGTHAQVYRM